MTVLPVMEVGSRIAIANGVVPSTRTSAPALTQAEVMPALTAPNFLLKIMPHVDGTPRICELVRYYMTDIAFKGAWTGPAALELFHHALAPVAQLPVREVLSATHIVTDLTLGLGEVVHDYLK